MENMMQIYPRRTKAEEALLRLIDETASVIPLERLHQDARDIFMAQGLPSKSLETWHYTDLRARVQSVAPLADASHIAQDLPQVPDIPGILHLPIINGRFRPDLVPETMMVAAESGVTILTLAQAIEEKDEICSKIGCLVESALQDPMGALHASLIQDALIIKIAPGIQLPFPMMIDIIAQGSAPTSIYPHVYICVGEGASITLLERYVATSGVAHQINAMIELDCAASAQVVHVCLDSQVAPTPSRAGQLISTYALSMGAHAQLTHVHLAQGGDLSRRQIFAQLKGEYVRLACNGLTMVQGQQHIDHTLAIEHLAKHGESRELYKHILDDQGAAIFQGKVIVAQPAQKTDGRMASHALLLSEDAAMSHKPELEIFADDVVCGHGATCGALDEEALFYVMSRGVPREEAESLLLGAFAREVLDSLEDEALQAYLETFIKHWLRSRTRASNKE